MYSTTCNQIESFPCKSIQTYFYTKVFGMTYAEKKAQEEAEYFEINDSDKKVDMSKNIEDNKYKSESKKYSS